MLIWEKVKWLWEREREWWDVDLLRIWEEHSIEKSCLMHERERERERATTVFCQVNWLCVGPNVFTIFTIIPFRIVT